ncbi:cell division protein FtsA, partial [Seonamhaeicola marinus]
GSQLKHLKQLVEYITGMDTRIGYPNEHLAGDSDEDITSPLFATAVGLVLDGLKRQQRKKVETETITETEVEEEEADTTEENVNNIVEEPKKERKSFLDKLTERVKDFLDNAE